MHTVSAIVMGVVAVIGIGAGAYLGYISLLADRAAASFHRHYTG